MPNYRRIKSNGGTYFFTLVTNFRQPLFTDDANVMMLRRSISFVKAHRPFSIDACVLLPDHLHCLWTLPPNDNQYAQRISLIKSNFTRQMKMSGFVGPCLSRSRKDRNESNIWQRRFWEHKIRDDNDYWRHVDYVHFNPVKHGLVKQVKAWRNSSFHRFVERGIYCEEWGGNLAEMSEGFGE